MSPVIVIPTYNEAHNVTQIVIHCFALGIHNLHIVVVDDASPDGTGRIADKLLQAFAGRLHIIHRPRRLGLGSAYRVGFRRALQIGADVVVQMSADFSHTPEYVPAMMARLNEADVVIGSRHTDGAVRNPPGLRWRSVRSRLANALFLRSLLGLETADGTSNFRAWRRSALEAIDVDLLPNNRYACHTYMTARAERLGLRLYELPILFAPRRTGPSTTSLAERLAAPWQVWRAPRNLPPAGNRRADHSVSAI